MNIPIAKAQYPCPKCELPSKPHCQAKSCNWLKCFRCKLTIGPRRTHDVNGQTVP